MPREVAHSFIATSALNQTGILKDTILKNHFLKSAFLLGTISPDSGYYFKSPFSKGEHISDLIHGIHENDSFIFLKHLLSDTHSCNKAVNEAFALGVMSHIILDSLWHPFIFSVTGDYYDINPMERTKARARHRRIEILIDCLILKQKNLNQNAYLIKNFLELEVANSIDNDFSKIITIKPKALISAWAWHKNLQSFFINQRLSNISHKLPLQKEFRALFANFTEADLELIENLILNYFNLNSNNWIEKSIFQIQSYFNEYERDPKNFTYLPIGPSANTGLIGISKYSGDYNIEEKLLYGY